MHPLPTPSLHPNLEFDTMVPSYQDMLHESGAPSPFKGELDSNGNVLDTKDPVMTGTLMRPYRLPANLREAARKRKAAIKRANEEEKRIAKEAAELAAKQAKMAAF